MWSLDTIRALNAEAGQRARRFRKKNAPFLLEEVEQLEEMPPFPFPNLGDAADEICEGHDKLDSVFCDHSGFGTVGEPALTPEQLKLRLKHLLETHGPILLGITEQGEFQLYVGVWRA
jgi:hypothetical protein